MRLRQVMTAPIGTFLNGIRRFFAFYRWMTEWDAMEEPPPVRRPTPLRPLLVRLAIEVATLLLLLGAIFGTIWLINAGFQLNWWVGAMMGSALLAAGIGGQVWLPAGWRPSVTLFGVVSAGAIVLWSTALAFESRGPVVDPSLPVERAILRYVLIATTLFLIRDLFFAHRPLMDWREPGRPRYELLSGAAALGIVVLFLWGIAGELPGLALTGLMLFVLFLAALAVSTTPADRLPRVALILIPTTVVVAWVQLVWSPWVLRVDRGDTHLSAELSTLIALVFLYELASSRYRKRKSSSLESTDH
ncbi:hypothetical protein BH23CHL2_BH23CHL2_14650 [soil metagenome]